MQIRHKLAIQFSLIVALLLFLALLLIYYLFNNQLKAEFYKGLESKALMTAEMLVKHTSLTPEVYNRAEDHSNEIGLPSKERIIIYNERFEKVYAFNKADVIPEYLLRNIIKSDILRFKISEYESMGIKYKNKLDENYILVSQGMFYSDDLLKLRNILIWVFMIIIGFVGVGGYVFSRQALSPVADMMQQIDAVFPAQIGKRLDVSNSKDELSRLAGMFNQLLDRAEEAFLNQKGFLSNISHEIKNPLTSMISRLDVLLQKERTPTEYQAVLTSTLTDMHELKEISEQLMQLGKISSGDNNPSFQNLRLDELVWQVNSDIMKIYAGYKIYLDTSDLPEDPDRLNIKGNEQLLKTAISNLCVNACKFSSDHSAYLYIFSESHGFLSLEVRDKGKPIPEDEHDLIFKAFYRSPSTRHIKGSGIGLPLVQQILKMHKADLSLKSGSIEGNTFTIRFLTDFTE